MKKIAFAALVLSFAVISCKNDANTATEAATVDSLKVEMASFGDAFEVKDVKSKEEMAKIFSELKQGDTLNVQFESEIKATCKKKGCWMSMDLGNDEEAVVRFKDYGFFVPKEGAEGKSTIVDGKAFLDITSIDQLKHDAKDGGKSQVAIDSIVAPKIIKRIIATGVQIAK